MTVRLEVHTVYGIEIRLVGDHTYDDVIGAIRQLPGSLRGRPHELVARLEADGLLHGGRDLNIDCGPTWSEPRHNRATDETRRHPCP